jgi:hypothetical protein
MQMPCDKVNLQNISLDQSELEEKRKRRLSVRSKLRRKKNKPWSRTNQTEQAATIAASVAEASAFASAERPRSANA